MHEKKGGPRAALRFWPLWASQLIFVARNGYHRRHSGAREARTRNPALRLLMAYYVYLLASDRNGTLYIGVTNDIVRRVFEHKSKAVAGFTKRYGVDKLVWYEIYDDPTSAITREKELKKWRREWKIQLIEKQNPQWLDLYPQISS
jgi:putative endonuclease